MHHRPPPLAAEPIDKITMNPNHREIEHHKVRLLSTEPKLSDKLEQQKCDKVKSAFQV